MFLFRARAQGGRDDTPRAAAMTVFGQSRRERAILGSSNMKSESKMNAD